MTQPQYGYGGGYYPDPQAQQQAHAAHYQQAQANLYQQPQYPHPGQYGPPQGYGQPPAPQGPPLPPASLEDFLSQPNIGGGKAVSWKGKPDGFTLWTVVAR